MVYHVPRFMRIHNGIRNFSGQGNFPQYLADTKIKDEKQSQVLSERLRDNDTVEWGELGQNLVNRHLYDCR